MILSKKKNTTLTELELYLKILKKSPFGSLKNHPVRRLAPFSATSSPRDKPGRFGYLHTSLCALSHADVQSEVENAISRDLP